MFTNRNLYMYALELMKLEQGSILRILLNGRIKEFRRTNWDKVQSLFNDVSKIEKEYLQFDGNNPTIENPDTPQHEQIPKTLEGKTYEDYQKAINELMDKPVNINF